MKALWLVSFRPIGKSELNDHYQSMFVDSVKDLDFDIVLLGCGGYGVPLCDFIKTKLNKSAIYVGGGLQLLFGVMGQRWENTEMWKKIISENNCSFIKPSGNEIIKHKEIVEGGCYW